MYSVNDSDKTLCTCREQSTKILFEKWLEKTFWRTSLPLAVLDGLNQHFQATIHFPQSSAVDDLCDFGNFSFEKNQECWVLNPGQMGPEARLPSLLLCRPLCSENNYS